MTTNWFIIGYFTDKLLSTIKFSSDEKFEIIQKLDPNEHVVVI